MRAFSQLLDDLVYTRSRNTKLKLIGDYLKETPDPDRGYGLAALTGTLDIPAVKGAAVRAIAEERVDPVLLYMSRDYVGDMAETVALLWPKPLDEPPEVDDATISITEAIERLRKDFDQPLYIEDLAREYGMSVSGFHHHFRALTTMSPLQYQKQLRLQEARRLMVGEGLDAASAGHRVGYGDASQFTREYKRLFGAPPMHDVEQLRDGSRERMAGQGIV